MFAVYSDTDGSYFEGASHEDFVRFVGDLNSRFLPSLAKELGCVENHFAVDYEKAFSLIVFPMGDDWKPSAKRYAGKFSYYDTKPVEGTKLEIKGLEIKRGDTSRLARRMQKELIDILMSGESSVDVYVKFVESWKKRITLDPVELEDIVLSKSVKDLKDYKVRTKKDGSAMKQPAHVEMAKTLIERGEEVNSGDRVEYVVIDADSSPMTVIPASDYDGTFDRLYCWNEVVYPASYRVLASAVPYNWELFWLRHQRKNEKPLKNQLSLF